MTAGEQGFLMPGWGRPELVGALSACVVEWERLLGAPVLARDAALQTVVQRSLQLEQPSRSVGFGGVGHHLAELSRLANTGAGIGPVREQLGIVRELLASAQASLSPEERARAFVTASAGPPSSLIPPPMLSGYIDVPRAGGAAPPSPFASPSPQAAPASPSAMAPPRMLTSMGQRGAAPR